MTKKVIRLIISLVIIAAITICLILMGNFFVYFKYELPSETFLGAISSTTYASEEETAEAFVVNEFTGATASPVYTGYDGVKEMSADEINALNLTEEEKEQVSAGKAVTVHYTCNSKSLSSTTHLLQMGTEYKYYVSPSLVGAPLTNTYFESVFDGKKYLNCTADTSINMRMSTPQATFDSTYTQTIQFQDSLAYFNQKYPGQIMELYLREEDGALESYLKNPLNDDGKFHSFSSVQADANAQGYILSVELRKGGVRVPIQSLKKVQDVTDFIFAMDLDASYFVKTSYGFSMPNEKYKDVCKSLIDEDAQKAFDEFFQRARIHFDAKYYVTQGRLSAYQLSLNLCNNDDIISMQLQCQYTHFGSTEIILPEEIRKNEASPE